MKKITLIILLVFIISTLTNCKSQNKVVQKNVPFHITEKTYQNWIGGKQGSSGVNLVIKGAYELNPIHFETIFFQNREEKIVAEFNSNQFNIVLSMATLDNPETKNLIMSKNPQDEYGNEIPKKTKNIPFDLKEDEAVLKYNIDGKEYYYKITEIKKLDTIIYP